MENCVMCAEPITNPLCAACLQEGILQWLRERGQGQLGADVASLTRDIAITGNRKLRKHYQHGPIWCVTCGAAMRVCSYCYTHDVFDLIKREPTLISEFITFWNFDLGHMGWEREARAYLNE